MKRYRTSAPGRVCLFGEHQDYMQLPVIPAAINMRTTITITGSVPSDGAITINATDLGKTLDIDLASPFSHDGDDLDYFTAVIDVFKRHGHGPKLTSFSCDVSSQIPIKSGLSSSAALLVAWTGTVAAAAGIHLDPFDVGWYAYEAEHDVMEVPCGMMDQLSSAMGGIIHVRTVVPPVITPIHAKIQGLVVADTKMHKSTSEVLSKRVVEAWSGLDQLRELVAFELERTPFDVVEPHLRELNEVQRKRLTGAFRHRDITVRALRLLTAPVPDLKAIGALLTEHQAHLREHFEVSNEKIEAIIDAALREGALGAKLTGAGLGGSVVILAPGKEREITKAIEDLDAVPHVVEVNGGIQSVPLVRGC